MVDRHQTVGPAIPRIHLELRGWEPPSSPLRLYFGYALYYGFSAMKKAVMILSFILANVIIASIISGLIYITVSIGVGGIPLGILPTDLSEIIGYLHSSILRYMNYTLRDINWGDLREISLFKFDFRELWISPSFFQRMEPEFLVGNILFLSVMLIFIFVLNVVAEKGLDKIKDYLSVEFMSGRSKGIYLMALFTLLLVLVSSVTYLWMTDAFRKFSSLSLLVPSALIVILGILIALIWLVLSVFLLKAEVDVNYSFEDLERVIESRIKNRIGRGSDIVVRLCPQQLRSLVMEALTRAHVHGKDARRIIWGAMEDLGRALFMVEISEFHEAYLEMTGRASSLIMTFTILGYILWLSTRGDLSGITDFRIVLALEMLLWPLVMVGYKLVIHFSKFIRYSEHLWMERALAFYATFSLIYAFISLSLHYELGLTLIYILASLLLATRWIPIEGSSVRWYHPLYTVYTWLAYGFMVVKPIILVLSYLATQVLLSVSSLGIFYLRSPRTLEFASLLVKLIPYLKWEFLLLIAISSFLWIYTAVTEPKGHFRELMFSIPTVLLIIGLITHVAWAVIALLLFLLLSSLMILMLGLRGFLKKFLLATWAVIVTYLIIYEASRIEAYAVDLWILMDPLFSLLFMSLFIPMMHYILSDMDSSYVDSREKKDKEGTAERKARREDRRSDLYLPLGLFLVLLSMALLSNVNTITVLNFLVPPHSLIAAIVLPLLAFSGIFLIVIVLRREKAWVKVRENFEKYKLLEIQKMAVVLGEIYGLMPDPEPQIFGLIPFERRFVRRIEPECEYY